MTMQEDQKLYNYITFKQNELLWRCKKIKNFIITFPCVKDMFPIPARGGRFNFTTGGFCIYMYWQIKLVYNT